MSMSTCRHPGFYNPNKSKYCLYSLIEAVVELQSVSPSIEFSCVFTLNNMQQACQRC